MQIYSRSRVVIFQAVETARKNQSRSNNDERQREDPAVRPQLVYKFSLFMLIVFLSVMLRRTSSTNDGFIIWAPGYVIFLISLAGIVAGMVIYKMLYLHIWKYFTIVLGVNIIAGMLCAMLYSFCRIDISSNLIELLYFKIPLLIGGIIVVCAYICGLNHSNSKLEMPAKSTLFYQSLKYIVIAIFSWIVAGLMFCISASILNNFTYERIIYDSLSILSWYGSGILIGIMVIVFLNSKYFWIVLITCLIVIYVISANYFDIIENWSPLFNWLGYDIPYVDEKLW